MLSYFVVMLFMAAGAPDREPQKIDWRVAVPSFAATALLCVHFVGATIRTPYVWFVRPQKVQDFVWNVERSLAGADPNLTIADTVVPQWVMPQWIWPLTKYQYFLTLFPVHGKVVPRDRADLMFTEDGKLVRTDGQPLTGKTSHASD